MKKLSFLVVATVGLMLSGCAPDLRQSLPVEPELPSGAQFTSTPVSGAHVTVWKLVADVDSTHYGFKPVIVDSTFTPGELELKPGPYFADFRARGYMPKALPVEVEKGRIVPILANLEPIQTPPHFDPPTAKVWVDEAVVLVGDAVTVHIVGENGFLGILNHPERTTPIGHRFSSSLFWFPTEPGIYQISWSVIGYGEDGRVTAATDVAVVTVQSRL